MTKRLMDRRILVTGGATGIGAAVTTALLAQGARVAVLQRDAEELRAALDATRLADRVIGVHGDLARPGSAAEAVASAIDALGGLDGLVNNAAVTGPPAHGRVLEIDRDHLDRLIDVNLKGVIHCSVAAAQHMTSHGGGVIVSISSVVAHLPAPGAAVYAASKAGVIAFTRGLALELGASGVRALTVAPGDIATDSSIAPEPEPGERAVRSPALGRRGVASDIGGVVAFLLSDEAGYITGTDIVVDGGFLLG